MSDQTYDGNTIHVLSINVAVKARTDGTTAEELQQTADEATANGELGKADVYARAARIVGTV